jgi:hypothetical protein
VDTSVPLKSNLLATPSLAWGLVFWEFLVKPYLSNDRMGHTVHSLPFLFFVVLHRPLFLNFLMELFEDDRRAVVKCFE